MATTDKDFKVKNGLVVQGSSATVAGNEVLTTASDLDDLNNVNAPTPNDGDSLVYDADTQTWIPAAVSGGGGGTASDSFKTIAVAGQSNVVADSSTDTLTFVAGSNVNITTNATTDSITIDATDTNTTYSVSAETATGGANLRLSGSDATTDDVKIEGSGSVTVTRTDANTITISGTDTDNNTTYSVSAETATGGANLRLTGSDAVTDDVKIEGSGATTVTRTDANTITISSTDTNTTYTAGNGLGLSGTEFAINTSVTADLSTSQTLTNKTLGSGTTLGASLNASSNKITGLANPEADQDAATKAYVDAATAGLNVHDSVRVATTPAGGNIDLSTGLVNGTVIDGITLVTGNRVLVKNQSTASQNGVYIVPASGAASRATDYDTIGEVDAGDFIFVEAGTINAKTGWIQVNDVATLNSDPIEFTQFSGAGTYRAGTGLTLDGNEFSVTANTYQPIDADLTAIAGLNTTGWLQRTGADTWSLGTPPDTNTTYSVSAETTTGGANLRLTGSDTSTDDVKIQGSGNIAVTRTDANTISVAPDHSLDYETTVTSGATQILTATSPRNQFYTGSSAHTVNLPDTSTIKTGDWFVFTNNNSSGLVTVRTSTGSSLQLIGPGTGWRFTCISTAGNTTAAWRGMFESAAGTTGAGGSVVFTNNATIQTPNLTLSTTPSTAAGRLAVTGNTLQLGNGSTTLTFSDDTVAKTPTSHASTHGAAGSDPIAISASQVTGTLSQFNTALTDGDFATIDGAETLTNKTLTAPKFASAGEIDDANGAELIRFPATVASAVNEVTISNAATGAAPSVTATGDDTNISLNLVAKGTGTVQAGGVPVVTTTGTQTLTNKTLTNPTFSGQAVVRSTSGSPGMEIGRSDGTSSTPYIDFNSGATLVDYDSRIIASGGTGSIGGGSLQIVASSLTLPTTTATSPTAAGSTGLRNVTISTAEPTGGSDGDVWLVYV